MIVRYRRSRAPALRLLHCQKGIAALEFALVAPALLMLIFAIIIYSFWFSALLGVRHAADGDTAQIGLDSEQHIAGRQPSARGDLAQADAS